MITTIISDFSKVVLFPLDTAYQGSLNQLYKKLKADPNFDYFDHFELNRELLAFYVRLKKNFKVYMFTKSESGLESDPAIKILIDDVFDEVFTESEIGYPKEDPRSFKALLKKIDKSAEETLFIDDDEKRVDAAKEAGLTAYHFTDTKLAIDTLNEIIYFDNSIDNASK